MVTQDPVQAIDRELSGAVRVKLIAIKAVGGILALVVIAAYVYVRTA